MKNCFLRKTDSMMYLNRSWNLCQVIRRQLRSTPQTKVKALALHKISSKTEQRKLCSILWVKGHSRLMTYKKADALAMTRARPNILTPKPFPRLSIKPCEGFYERTRKFWHLERWRKLQDCKHVRNVITRYFGTVS